MNFNCDSIYEINPMLKCAWCSWYSHGSINDLYVEGDDDHETEDAQIFFNIFSEKYQQIQNCVSNSEKRKVLCDFLKLECVFDYFMDLMQNKKSIKLWNVHLLFSEYNRKRFCSSKAEIFKAYLSFVNNVFNGKFNTSLQQIVLLNLDDDYKPHVCLLPNGWVEILGGGTDEKNKDYDISQFFDSDLNFVGDIIRSDGKYVDFLDFMQTEAYMEYMSKKCTSIKYDSKNIDDIRKIQLQIENRELSLESLSEEQLMRLDSLYAHQIGMLEDENNSLSKEVRQICFDIITGIITKELDVEKSKIKLSSSLRKDLCADELDIEELFSAIGKEFHVEITDAEIADTFIVEDLINLVTIKNKKTGDKNGK